MSEHTDLGAYLRARRDLTRPADVGLALTGRRRVPGLRRDEVAQLAGISSEYYVRLEQGRDQHPSAQVLDALARVLRLEPAATAMPLVRTPCAPRSSTPRCVPCTTTTGTVLPPALSRASVRWPAPRAATGTWPNSLAS
ncbi:helix-turn-helix domain-containing protein [Streptomyces scopuliridis]|uniref:HTH cro/C1-type domain-containing protein n=1 Tax=Streptomyces scopuliridis RB72 TaxID=1440053 RepID=A0A2T7SWK0_9ACTN|nr:hypothetical protein Y717_24420 [Streptomyces scopuliridis RB72]